jgi:hypothetical protein
VLKNDASPQVRVPAVANAANHRGWRYNSRYYDGRCYDSRPRCNYDWPVRTTMSIGATVKAGTTSTRSARTINTDK